LINIDKSVLAIRRACGRAPHAGDEPTSGPKLSSKPTSTRSFAARLEAEPRGADLQRVGSRQHRLLDAHRADEGALRLPAFTSTPCPSARSSQWMLLTSGSSTTTWQPGRARPARAQR
jgi:hypothetical protein